jgi:ADP-dependent NAD(P)H-hydrate dehydratase / NAD(P)H-hydrate epimerase
VSGKRWLLILGLALLVLLGGAGVSLLILLPNWVEARVLSTAEDEGVTLEPKDIAFGWGWVQITQARVTLDRVRSVGIQVGRIDVALDGMTPSSIQLTNVEGQVLGSLTNVGLELSEWTKAHAGAYALPLGAQNVHATFVERAGAAPWLDVSGGSLTHTRSGGVFAAQHAHFLGVDLGKVGAGFTETNSAIALGFGEADLGRAPFRVEVSPAPPTPTAKFTVAPIAAERLAQPLGIALPVRGVIVSSETTLAFSGAAGVETIQGATSVTLKGYVPPHPFELDGFIFGDTTTFDGKFTIPPLRDRIALTDAHLKAGAFELRGNGLIVRSSDHSQANLTLSGQLPCSALASVEANSRVSKILGSALGAKAGDFAEKLVNGSVAIGLSVAADTRNIAAAKVERTIGVGCGLHPLTLAELEKLVPLPPEVTALLRSLPALPADLSSLPALSGLPALPALPSGLPPLPSGAPALPAGLPQLPNLGLPALPVLPTVTPAPTPKPTTTSTSTSKAPAKPASSSGG